MLQLLMREKFGFGKSSMRISSPPSLLVVIVVVVIVQAVSS